MRPYVAQRHNLDLGGKRLRVVVVHRAVQEAYSIPAHRWIMTNILCDVADLLQKFASAIGGRDFFLARHQGRAPDISNYDHSSVVLTRGAMPCHTYEPHT